MFTDVENKSISFASDSVISILHITLNLHINFHFAQLPNHSFRSQLSEAKAATQNPDEISPSGKAASDLIHIFNDGIRV